MVRHITPRLTLVNLTDVLVMNHHPFEHARWPARASLAQPILRPFITKFGLKKVPLRHAFDAHSTAAGL